MAVKSFTVALVYQDWSTGHSEMFYETVKARNLAEAEEHAAEIALEAGPDVSLVDTARKQRLNIKRLRHDYNRMERRQARPVAYRHRYSKGRRYVA